MTDETDDEEQPVDSGQDDSAGETADDVESGDAAGELGAEFDVAEDDLERAGGDDGDIGLTGGDESDEELAWVEGERGDGDAFPAAPEDATSGTSEPGDDPMLPDQSTDEDAAADVGEAFEDMAVDDVEADEVWSDVADEEQTPGKTDETTPEESAVETEVAEVSKHEYCESCEYFSEAPEIHCTHDGTEILDFVDMEHVRLSNCPIVAERRGLEQGVSKGSTDLGEIQRD